MRRFSAIFAPLLLTTIAGRVFWISPPNDGSKATHQTSPLRGCIADQALAPLFSFLFMLNVVRHLAILIEEAAGSTHGEVFNLGQNHIVEFRGNDEPDWISPGLGIANARFFFRAIPANTDALGILPIHSGDRPSSVVAARIDHFNRANRCPWRHDG